MQLVKLVMRIKKVNIRANSLIRILLLVFFVYAFTNLNSCRIEEYSSIPQIWYKSFILFDTLDALGNPVKMGILTFDFLDGDGDFGLPEPNENDPPELQHNLFLNGYYMENGQTQAIPESDPMSNFLFRVPSIDEQVYGKPFEGTISVEMLFYSIEYSRIKYHFYVSDLAGNISNIAQTPFIDTNQ